MNFIFEERHSDSPLVERVWRTQSDQSGSFISQAASQLEIVITKQNGLIWLTVRGPETKALHAPVPGEAEFFGIQFKIGTFMPDLPVSSLINGGIDLPEATGKTVWLNGSAWQIPNFENADTFVNRLVRSGQLEREPLIEAALKGQLKNDLSQRSIQRRFLRATGIPYATMRQIERARQAANMLQRGFSILDTVAATGYADQPHLTRALKYFIGQTPAQIITSLKL